jgi:hypothetical protein
MFNSTKNEEAPVPASTPAPAESAPAVAVAPVVVAEPVSAPVPAPVAAAPAAVAAPVVAAVPAGPAVKMELPKTTGTTKGGWNRFAGYNPNDAKNKTKGKERKRY